MTIDDIKKSLLGDWKSIAPEIRPSSLKNADGTLKPFYLSRQFKYLQNDKFELVVNNNADANGKVTLTKMFIRGHMEWKGAHPIAEGAQKVDFIADEAYSVTPIAQAFADAMNLYTKGFDNWEVGKEQSILKKAFPPFGLAEGQIFSECDLVYLFNDMLFWGARNIDGRGFDKEENRPTNLQIPLIRVK